MRIDSLGNINTTNIVNSSYYTDANIEERMVVNKSESSNKSQFNKEYRDKSNNDKKEIIDKKKLDKSLEKLNRFLEGDSAHAEYSVHEDLGDVMIKIVDTNTKEVILEVPPKKILDMVASMCKQVGIIDKKA